MFRCNRLQHLPQLNNYVQIDFKLVFYKLMIGGNRMFRKWKFIFLLTISVFVLAACGKSLRRKSYFRSRSGREAFHLNDKNLQKKLTALNYINPLDLRLMISQMHKISSLQKTKKHSSFSSIQMKKVTVNCFMICFLQIKAKKLSSKQHLRMKVHSALRR